MKSLMLAGAALLLAAGTASAAQPAGPRASSENNWAGMSTLPAATAPTATGYGPHYVWQEGYDRGGKWHGHWALVQ